MFALEEVDALFGLPFLIFEFAGVEGEESLVVEDGGFFVVDAVAGGGEQEVDGGGFGLEFVALCERLDGDLGLVEFGGGEGESGPGVGVGGVDGGGLLEGGFGGSELAEAHEVLAVAGEHIGVLGVSAEERGVE